MIAASDAKDGSEGLLQFWDTSTQLASSTSSTSVTNSEPSKSLPAFSLGKRGWAYQERQMAPRILHFTRYGVMWECCVFISTARSCRLLDVQRSRLNVDGIMKQWTSITEEYSMRNLSYSADKLSALSGLAAAVGSLIVYEANAKPPIYLAGIWPSHIHQQLFWCSVAPYKHHTEEQPLHNTNLDFLPSWSWASYRGPIVASGYIFKQLLEPSGYWDEAQFPPFDSFNICLPILNQKEQTLLAGYGAVLYTFEGLS
ncbi:hypothetical protein P280DRAFT_536004 [Massarina eburnea CBS 473.64]|uniref:Heterokaryon incompatibility domain-containing protein n=1 Tax=Massarina eburnea CBS 473.64 TaxID=1395130 RepID=A0A6A6RNF2_9PLEO|nr:hypothetical protein P280DRAFT_536004 [Massarina eburnea CBS 473.64]